MELLLDTHALLWWLDGDIRLPVAVRKLLSNEGQSVFVSAATAWEISTKARLGKLHVAEEIACHLSRVIQKQGFLPLPISVEHAERAGALGGRHRDPFDRMLIAQAQAESLTLVSNEAIFDSYGVRRFWKKLQS